MDKKHDVVFHITKGRGFLEVQIITPEDLDLALTNKVMKEILTKFSNYSMFHGPRETRRFEATIYPPEHGVGWFIELGSEEIDFNPATNVVAKEGAV